MDSRFAAATPSHFLSGPCNPGRRSEPLRPGTTPATKDVPDGRTHTTRPMCSTATPCRAFPSAKMFGEVRPIEPAETPEPDGRSEVKAPDADRATILPRGIPPERKRR